MNSTELLLNCKSDLSQAKSLLAYLDCVKLNIA
jgi:hypothetical protein